MIFIFFESDGFFQSVVVAPGNSLMFVIKIWDFLISKHWTKISYEWRSLQTNKNWVLEPALVNKTNMWLASTNLKISTIYVSFWSFWDGGFGSTV